MGAYFSDSDWVINQKTNFMSDPSLNASRFKLRSSVQNAERLINQKGGTITSGKIIAEQTLGFWTSLFENHHYRLIGGSPIKCFPHKPPVVNRTILAGKLNEIRLFRNRVYHNEPVCFLNDTIDFAHVQTVIQSIYDILNWMDPDLADYVSYFDNIHNKIKSGNNLN